MIILAALLLFGSGILACLAMIHGFYASAAAATLIGAWILGAGLWRQARLQPLRAQQPAPPDAGHGLAQEVERRRLRIMLDQVPAPLVTFAADGVLQAVNRAARTLFRTDDRIVRAPAALRDAIEHAAPGERTILKLASAPGGGPGVEIERSYALSVAVTAGPEGAVRLAVLTDIQAELQAAEAAALRDLLQLLSHEIMNSLTPVTSLTESAHAMLSDNIAAGSFEDVPRVAEALETILRRARGLDRFVQGYRILARVPPPMLRPSSVSALLRDAAALFETRWQAPGMTLTLQLPEPDIVARLDADLLTQALLNLLTNGAQAALAGSERPPGVTLSGFMQANDVAFRVSDSGDGVPAGQEDTIFRPFFTLKPQGTGIGLGLARQIAHGHGGTLVLEPAMPGRGASFLLSL